jgi:hypothetical protein
VTPEAYALKVLEEDLETAAPERRHISDAIAGIMKDVPPEDWASLPS